MQHRMKTHQLTKEQMEALLSSASTGSLATLGSGGSPYVTPVHFLYLGGAVYIHGLPKGQKLDNIRADSRVGMAVYEMDGLLHDPDGQPCNTNTKYESVILSGDASLVGDMEAKREVLAGIVKKYTPHLDGLPETMVAGTAVIKIEIREMTGKYYG